MKPLNELAIALQFLTRLPISSNLDYSPKNLGGSVVFYPLAGLILGGLLWLTHELLGDAAPLLDSALVLAAWAALTGGLHLDGLADSADAWAGGLGDRERSLRIMQDPNAGPIAVAAIVLLLLVKFAALAEAGNAAATALLWVPALARAAVPALLLTTPYVRAGGLGGALAENLPRTSAALATGIAALATGVALGPWPVLAAVFTVWRLRALMLARLGGCTGDTLGASIEIVEAAALAGFVLAGR